MAGFVRADMAMAAPEPAMSEEAVGEAHVYTLPTRITLEPGVPVTAALFPRVVVSAVQELIAPGVVPWRGYLANSPGPAEANRVPVQVWYTLKRPRGTPFGDRPVPGGTVQVYQADSLGRVQLVGEARSSHTAPGRDLRVQAGEAFDVTAERVQTDYSQEQLPPPRRGLPARQRVTASYREREAAARDGRRAGSARRCLDGDDEQPAAGEAVRDRGPLPRVRAGGRRSDAHVHGPGGIVTVQLLHVSDPHFGGLADVGQVEALEAMIPDLRPDAVVLSGDLTQRARHGEFQRARAFVNVASKSAPVYVLPGNHDVAWWWRPFFPFGRGALYRKYRRYFGEELTPTLTIPGAVIAGALTANGVGWLSLTWRPRDLAVMGHLPKREFLRVQKVFAEAPLGLARVLVVHHNVLRGEISRRMGLARWRQAQRRILASGAEVVLCAHDHQEGAEMLGDRVVISTASTVSTRARGGLPASFNFVTIEPTAVQITFFRWDRERGRFQPSDTFAFARATGRAAPAAVG